MSPISAGSPHSERPSHPPSPASPPSPAATATASSPRPPKDRIFYLPPRHRRTTSSKVHSHSKWPNDSQTESSGSGTETKQGPSPQSKSRRRAVRQASEKTLALPTSRMSTSDPLLTMSPPLATRPLSRRSPSPSSSSSPGSPGSARVAALPSAGIGRKVAASLDLFKESIPTPSNEDVNPFERPRPVSSASKRRPGPSHAIEDMAEAQFEFVKRSDWPDREAAAIRREKSMTGLERVRTQESASSSTSIRESDARRSQKRKMSFRDTVLNDLVQWRNAVAEDVDRGRPRDRGVWHEDVPQEEAVESSSTAGTGPPAPTYYDRPPSSDPLRTLPPSIPQSHSPEELPPLSLETSGVIPTSLVAEHELPSPAQVSPRDQTRSAPPAPDHLPVPIPPSFTYPPTTASDVTSYSPWSTDDESAWDSASITTTSTTEASSPFPLSPSRTSPAPQLLVRHASDEDEEQQQRMLQTSRPSKKIFLTFLCGRFATRWADTAQFTSLQSVRCASH